MLVAVVAAAVWFVVAPFKEQLTDPCASVCQGCTSCSNTPGQPPIDPQGIMPGFVGLPPASANDTKYCNAKFPGDPKNEGSCFALVNHNCVAGLQGDDKVPALLRGYQASALQQVYSAGQGMTHKSGGKTKAVYNQVPARWTAVCAARPKMVGKGKCKHVTPYEWRMHTFGHNDTSRKGQCDGLFIKAKFRGGSYVGKIAKEVRK